MSVIHAVVSGSILIRTEDLPPYVLERLRLDLAFPNPKYVARKRFGYTTFGIPEKIECLRERGGLVHIPRGAVDLVRKRCADRDIDIEFDDQRCEGNPLPEVAEKFELRPYQSQAIQAVRKRKQGLIVASCGGGKTTIGLGLIRDLGLSTLVIVHTRDLLEQWRSNVLRLLGIKPALYAGGHGRKVKPITIATIQTLVNRDRSAISDEFGLLIVDECHHSPAKTYQEVINDFPAKYRIGLTATAFREDGLTKLMNYTMGPPIFEVEYTELLADGYLMRPEVEEVITSFEYELPERQDAKGRSIPPTNEEVEKCMQALISDHQRNQLIADNVASDAKAGHCCLVLSRRVEHCEVLTKLINGLGLEARLLVGAVKHPERIRILNDLRDGKLRVAVASTIADEGLDVPRLDRLALAYPERAKRAAIQRLGRLARPHEGKKEAVLSDYVDAKVPLLKRRWQARRRAFKKILGARHRQMTL